MLFARLPWRFREKISGILRCERDSMFRYGEIGVLEAV